MRLTLLPAAVTLLALAANAAENAPIAGRVLDADRNPIPGATVTLYLDDVEADPRDYRRLKSVATDDSGSFKFVDLPTAYYLVVVARPGSAKTFRTFVLEENSDFSHDFVLRKPVRSSLIVRDESGQPLAGARLRSLDLRDESGEFWFRNKRNWEAFATLPPPSDETGRIELPPLPEGAVIKPTIEHDDLAPARLEDVPVRPGVVAEATLRPGAAVVFKVAPDKSGQRPAEAEIDVRHDPFTHPSTVIDHRLPLGADGAIRITLEPGRYQFISLSHEAFHFTPAYSPNVSKGEYIRLGDSAHHEFVFVPHRKVEVRGRVVDESGDPLKDVYVKGDIPNVGPDGRVPEREDEWAHAGWDTTDANGEYVLKLAAGKARVSFQGSDYLPDERYTTLDVAPDGSAVAPDIRVRPLPKVTGTVVDAQRRPVPNAVVRFRGLLRGHQPTKTDDQGRFELSPPWLPTDFDTDEPRPVQPLVAFHPRERLAARAEIDLTQPDTLKDVTLTLAPHEPGALIDDFRDELSPFERGELPEDRAAELADDTLKGQPALDLEGTWLNIDPPTNGLADFRGRYVLLDFWFIGCGPCHHDFPSVQLLHELYKDRGLVVIAIHDNSANADAVRAYAAKEGMNVPILVDEPDGRTNSRYEGKGLRGYPSHILIAPDGTVLEDDEAGTPSPSLRTYKLELIRELLLDKE